MNSNKILYTSSENLGSLVDVHISYIPVNLWSDKYNYANLDIISNIVSVGFIRVHPGTKINKIRHSINVQLGKEVFPEKYVFLKQIGKRLVLVREKQEFDLVTRNFLPPESLAPELYILPKQPPLWNSLAFSVLPPITPQNQPPSPETPQPQFSRIMKSSPLPSVGSPVPSVRHHRTSVVSNKNLDYLPENSVVSEVIQMEEDYVQEDSTENEINLPNEQDSGFMDPTETNNNNEVVAQSSESYLNEAEKKVEDILISSLNRQVSEEELPQSSSYHFDASVDSASKIPRSNHSSSSSKSTLKSSNSLPTKKHNRLELLAKLEKLRNERKLKEKEREGVMRIAKNNQLKLNQKRNKSKDLWKRRFFEEKKKTAPLADVYKELRNEYEAKQRRLLQLPEIQSAKFKKNFSRHIVLPSIKNSSKIEAGKLQYEIQMTKRQVEAAKNKLTGEMKLRHQAENDVKILREELLSKKIRANVAYRDLEKARNIYLYKNESDLRKKFV